MSCGNVTAPFAGLLLTEFETHIKAHGNPFGSNWEAVKNRSAIKYIVGGMHAVAPLHKQDMRALGITAPAVLKLNGKSDVQAFGRDRCLQYLKAIWNMWLAWILGELGISPRTRAAWLNADRAFGSQAVVVDHWTTLDQSLQQLQPAPQTVGSDLVDQLMFLTRAGLAGIDIKPRDMFLRRESGRWATRVGDVELSQDPYFGLLDGTHQCCRDLIILANSMVYLACGPHQHHPAAQAFVGRASDVIQSGMKSNELRDGADITRNCCTDSSCRKPGLPGSVQALGGFHGGMLSLFSKKTTSDTRAAYGKRSTYSIATEILQKLHTQDMNATNLLQPLCHQTWNFTSKRFFVDARVRHLDRKDRHPPPPSPDS